MDFSFSSLLHGHFCCISSEENTHCLIQEQEKGDCCSCMPPGPQWWDWTYISSNNTQRNTHLGSPTWHCLSVLLCGYVVEHLSHNRSVAHL